MPPAVTACLRCDKLPHLWCPGCGNGIIIGALIRAIQKLGLAKDEVVVVTGIGCSARSAGYLDFNTVQTTHGRALAFALGIKITKPKLTVIVLTGDGDGCGIGGNHLIHCARRNINLTTVLFNNYIYGMTGGQYSPLTPPGKRATTAPYGTVEPTFDLCELVVAAGATYVARSTTYHVTSLSHHLEKAIAHEGFSFVEVLTACPVGFGRRNEWRTPVDMLRWQREVAVPIGQARKMDPAQREGKVVIGEFVNVRRPEYIAEYARMAARVAGSREENDHGAKT